MFRCHAFGVEVMQQTLDTCLDRLFELLDNLQLSANDCLETIRTVMEYVDDEIAYNPNLTVRKAPPPQSTVLANARTALAYCYRLNTSWGSKLADELANVGHDLTSLAGIISFSIYDRENSEKTEE